MTDFFGGSGHGYDTTITFCTCTGTGIPPEDRIREILSDEPPRERIATLWRLLSEEITAQAAATMERKV